MSGVGRGDGQGRGGTVGDLNFAVTWSGEFPRKRGEEMGRIVSLWMQKQEWTKEERERKSV